MRKGTFSVQKANSNSTAHNSRINPPKYLIGLETGSENYYELLQSDDDFISQAKSLYKEKIKQSMQKKQIENLIQETVLTLKEEQNENDVKNLFVELNKKYGGHELLEVSIHRDEGHFEKNGIAYYPTKNILQIENDWYICSDPTIAKPKKNDFDEKVDINKFEKVYNYHAHAKFSMFDRSIGKTARMQKKDMSERIKFVSNELGLAYAPGINRQVKKSVNQVKDEHLSKAHEQRLQLAKVKDLKSEVAAIKRKLIESQKAEKEHYAALRELEANLKSQIKDKSLTIEDMQLQLDTLNVELTNNILENHRGNEVYQDLQTQNFVIEEENSILKNSNKALQDDKKVLSVKVHDLEEKSVSRPSMSDYNYILEENKTLKEENTKLLVFEKKYNFNQKLIEDLYTDLECKEKSKKGFFGWVKTQFEEFKEKILGLENENTQLKNNVKALELENSELGTKIEELQDTNLDLMVYISKQRDSEISPTSNKQINEQTLN